MLKDEEVEIIQEIVKKYGKEKQVMIAIEEMSELTKELLKNINRNSQNRSEIIEELADVLITIIELIIIYNVDGTRLVDDIKYKLNRQKERMESDIK